MKNKMKTLKALVPLLGFAMMLPFSAQAQTTKSMSMYHEGSLMDDDPSADWYKQSSLNNRDNLTWNWNINNNGIGQPEVPLGSGLLILGAAGAGYFIAKRRKNNKKNVALILAALMLLGFTQCKKETVEPVGKTVHITLRMKGNNTRANVEPTGESHPNWATVDFVSGDKMYIGNGGKYVGYLTYNGSDSWSGDLTGLVETDYLHLYFLGNKEPLETGVTAGSSSSFSVSIADQTSEYPVISYNHSTELYETGKTSYNTTTLYNKCAIVKFTTTDIDADITIMGMKNTVTVDFSLNNGAGDPDNPYTYTKTGDGNITLHKVSNTERWAVLLPQDAVTNTLAYSTNYATHDPVTVPQIEANEYKPDGITLNLVDNYISASATTKVLFSQGNLQYLGTTSGSGTWRFAEHQYDFMGDGPSSGTDYHGNVTIDGYSKYNATADMDAARDLFGWGASGYNDKYPYLTSTNTSSYYIGSLTGTGYDWGVYHSASGSSNEKITNGGDKSWRLLTSDEWTYIKNRERKVYTRIDFKETKKIFCAATVVGTKGIIIFPDNWTGAFSRNIKYANESGVSFDTNVFDAEEWAVMELLGCAFLPATHVRVGVSLSYLNVGYYWTSTVVPVLNNAEYRGGTMEFNNSGTVNISYQVRRLGNPVRLVYNV
jgi:hypothetical protein